MYRGYIYLFKFDIILMNVGLDLCFYSEFYERL